MAMSALQQAKTMQAQLQPQNSPLQPGQEPQQTPPGQQAGSSLAQAFMQFLQQQHGQSNGQKSFLNYLPWFGQAQQQLDQTQQSAFQPPATQSESIAKPGSGRAQAEQQAQQQVNRGGDMTTRFLGNGYT